MILITTCFYHKCQVERLGIFYFIEPPTPLSSTWGSVTTRLSSTNRWGSGLMPLARVHLLLPKGLVQQNKTFFVDITPYTNEVSIKHASRCYLSQLASTTNAKSKDLVFFYFIAPPTTTLFFIFTLYTKTGKLDLEDSSNSLFAQLNQW